jgi:membrane glycosyltransferase
VRWESQRARRRSGVLAIAAAEVPATLLGAGLGAWLAYASPELLVWLAPLWVPWLLAFPIAMLASSRHAGALAARLQLFAVPCESNPDEIVLRAHELRTLTMGDQAARFRDLVLDPVLLSAHLARIADRPEAVAEVQLARLCERALRAGPAGLGAEERDLLAADADSMRWLHCHAWRSWPVESWQLGRDQPQLPSELPPEALQAAQ